MRVYIPVSAGELIDRITILEIKSTRIPDAAVAASLAAELEDLRAICNCFPKLSGSNILSREQLLREVNELLWNMEDRLRALEENGDFGADFVAVARQIRHRNDERAKLKRQIDELAGSALREAKWFSSGR